MKKYSISFPGTGLILITDNWVGDKFCLQITTTYAYMKVQGTTDYTFYFKLNYTDEVVIPVTSLNDIAGTAPLGNNASHDFGTIVSSL